MRMKEQITLEMWDQMNKEQIFELAYNMGFQYGYQDAIIEVIKIWRRMKKYGGDKQKKRAD